MADDDRGQQFVLEVAVVAILVASTVVLVSSFTPTQPGIEDPRTHERTATEAQDILDALAAESVPRCTTVAVQGTDGGSVDREICPGRQRLDQLIVADLLGGTARTCKEISDQVGPGKEVAVVLHGSIREKVLCGDLPPADEPTASQAAFSTTVLRFNYTHTFTDLDRYNGNDPTAEGKQITSDGAVHTEEARAWQRVTTVPTRMSWPVVSKGDAVEARVNVQGGAVGGNQTLQAAGSTEESADGGLEYASFYGEQLPWCPEGWDSVNNVCLNDDGGDPRDDAPHLEDDASYDWKLDGRYFGDDPAKGEVKFRVRINETAAAPIEAGTQLVCNIPPDWRVDESEISVTPNFKDTESTPHLSGSENSGWTLNAEIGTSINASNATLEIPATPPNPSNTGNTSDDPKRPVYVFRCWLENDAHSVLDIPVDLKPSEVGDLPITSGVIATVSPASGMDTDGEGWWGVSVINPTSESLDVTEVRVESLSKTALFSRLNRSVGRPEGTWEVVGLQGSEQHIRNGHFELGTDIQNLTGSKIPEWSTETWAPDPGRPTAVATDGRGLPHVVYSRARDGQLVHAWQQRTAKGRPNWTRELLDYHGWVDAESVVVDDRGTPDRTLDDRLLVFAVAPKDKNEDPEDYNSPANLHYATQAPEFSPHVGGEVEEQADRRVVLLSRTMDGTWDAEHLSDADLVSSMSAEVGDGSWWLSYAVWDGDDPRLLVQRNLTTDDTCDGIGRVTWDCQVVVSDDRPDHVSTVWNGSSLKMLYQESERASDVKFCTFPCNGTVELGETEPGNATVDLALGANDTLHAAWVGPDSSNVTYAERPEVCQVRPDGCWETEEAVGPDSGTITSLGVGLINNGTRPEIAYATDEDGIRRARRAGSDRCKNGDEGWTCATVDGDGGEALSAVPDDRGTLHVSYVVPTGSGADQLRYANSRMGTGDWSFWTGPIESEGTTEVGGSVSAALDDGEIHVAYQDTGAEALRYATGTGDGNWSIEMVDWGDPRTARATDVTTVGGEPRIAYTTREELRYARPATGSQKGNCGVDQGWICETVAKIGVMPYDRLHIDRLGNSTAILFPHVSGSLVVAFDGASVANDRCPSSPTWQCLEVPENSLMPMPSMSVQAGDVHVAWFAFSDLSIRYANATVDPITGSYVFGAVESFEEREVSGVMPRIATGKLDNVNRVWIMEEAFGPDWLPVERLATRPATESGPLLNYSRNDDDCIDEIPPGWSCQDVTEYLTGWGVGELIFWDGQLHGVYFQDDTALHYVSSNGSDCPATDDLGCSDAITRAEHPISGVYDKAAIVTPNGTPWIFHHRGGELRVAKRTDGDQPCLLDDTWNCEVVDPGDATSVVGRDPSVAVDPLERAHVSHYDPLQGNLMYSVQDSRSWRTAQVDNGTSPKGMGRDLASAWDAGTNLHIVYHRRGTPGLRYLTNATGSWEKGIIRGEVNERAVTVANDTVHVLVDDPDDAGGYGVSASELVYGRCPAAASGACRNRSAWSWENVTRSPAGFSMLDIETLSNGTVQILFRNASGATIAATRAPGRDTACKPNMTTGWRCRRVPVDPPEAVDLTVGPDDRIGVATLRNIDHRHEADIVGLLWVGSDHYWLNYTEDTGTGFSEPETIAFHHAGLAGTDPPLNEHVSLDYTSTADPRIAYSTRTLASQDAFDELLVAKRDAGVWTNATVETIEDNTAHYMAPELTVGDDDKVAVVYGRSEPDAIRSAVESASTDSCPGGDDGWSCRTVHPDIKVKGLAPWKGNGSLHTVVEPDEWRAPQVLRESGGVWLSADLPTPGGRAPGDVGYYSDIALTHRRTSTGLVETIPHISYYDRGNGSLKYAVREDDEWEVETVDRNGDSGLFSSIAINRSGPMIAYWDRQNEELRFASRRTGSWDVERVNGTGAVGSTGFVDLRVDDAGRPNVVHQVENGSERALALAVRDLPNGTTCGTATSGNWSCKILDEVTDSPTGVWSSLTIDGVSAEPGSRSILARRTDATGTSVPRVTNSTDTLVDCSGDGNWTCQDLTIGGLGPAYPSHAADEFGRHVGLYLDSGTDDVPYGSPSFPGGWEPIPSDVYQATDRADPGTDPCTASGWGCREVMSDRSVARPDVAISGSRSHAVLEDGTKRTFLYGTDEGWGRTTVVGGVNASIVDQSVGDRAVRLDRTFDDRTWDHEANALTQTFTVGPDTNVSAAILEFNWTKAVTGDGGKLALDTFETWIAIQGPDQHRPDVAWSQRSPRGFEDPSTVRIPVTGYVDDPGSYEFRVGLEARGKMLESGASATVQFTVDEVSLRTFENKAIPINNSRFDLRSDWMGYHDGSTWVLADDGGWEAGSRFGSGWDFDLKRHEYAKVWNATRRPDELLPSDRHATVETTVRNVWPACYLPWCPYDRDRSGSLSNTVERSISLLDNRTPANVRLDAAVYGVGESYYMADAVYPRCNRHAHPTDDPCSSYYDGEIQGIKSSFPEDAGTVQVRMTLIHEDGNRTHRFLNRSVRNLCESSCRLGPWDVTEFVRDQPADRNNYTVETKVTFDWQAIDPANKFTWGWRLYRVVTGVDDVLVEADYGGGTAMRWTGQKTVPERSSQDWVFRVFGNGERTFSGGDRVRVDTSYDNGYGTEALQMPRYGLYQVDVRPENATCDLSCEGHGGGYDINASACVTGGVGRARAAAKGRTCYVNDPNATLTRGIEQAVRDKSTTEVVGGEGRFNTFPARDPDGSCNHARVNWNFTKVRDAYEKAGADLNLDPSVGKVHLTLHSPAYGAPVWTSIEPELSGTERIPLCELFFEGAHVVKAELPITVEAPVEDPLGNGTVVNVQTARKADYFTVVPRDREGDDGLTRGLPAVGVELRTWWRSG